MQEASHKKCWAKTAEPLRQGFTLSRRLCFLFAVGALVSCAAEPRPRARLGPTVPVTDSIYLRSASGELRSAPVRVSSFSTLRSACVRELFALPFFRAALEKIECVSARQESVVLSFDSPGTLSDQELIAKANES